MNDSRLIKSEGKINGKLKIRVHLNKISYQADLSKEVAKINNKVTQITINSKKELRVEKSRQTCYQVGIQVLRYGHV